MALTDANRLRNRLGETVPTGGDETDTLFTDEEIQDFLDRFGGVEESLLEAWEVKAARLSSLVDTIEGSSRRAMSDLHKNALAHVKALGGLTTAEANEGGTTIGRIVRSD